MTFLVCDTNVWIEAAADPSSSAAQMLAASRRLGARVAVSKHSIFELAAGTLRFGVAAETLARDFEELPYYPIGAIRELLGTIAELSGTLADMRTNESLRRNLGLLAKRGTDLRDRGALIDALHGRADYFVTSDKGLVGAGPRGRIESEFAIRIRPPLEMLEKLEPGHAPIDHPKV